jgi:hypothetical protein
MRGTERPERLVHAASDGIGPIKCSDLAKRPSYMPGGLLGRERRALQLPKKDKTDDVLGS